MNTSEKLDWIYDWTSSLMTEGRFGDVDRVLDTMVLADYSIDEVLGWLTATLPGRSKLPSRKKFYQAVEDLAKARGIWEPGLLEGLE